MYRRIQKKDSLLRLWIVAIVGVGLLTVSFAQTPAVDRETRWAQDIKLFADELSAHQLDFSKLYADRGFSAELASIQADLPKLTDAAVTLRLMKLVASANIGHNLVGMPFFKMGFDRLAITLNWYADDLSVTQIDPKYSAALGTRVIKIGTKTPKELLTGLAPYVAHENDNWLKQQSPNFLTAIPILQQIGACGSDGRVEFTVAKPSGEPFTFSMTAAHPVDVRDQVSAIDVLHIPMALYRKQPKSYYWYEYLTDSKALYIQYNRCDNDPKLAFKDFTADMFAFGDSHTVSRVIVDLRFNGGGNSSVIFPLLIGLRSRKEKISQIYALIGPSTFSSGQDNAIDLKRGAQAILIGEPTGEKLNSYGEVKSLTLPNSGLYVQYTTKLFRFAKDSDPLSLEPDIVVQRTLEDALAGRDPVMDAALRHSPKP